MRRTHVEEIVRWQHGLAQAYQGGGIEEGQSGVLWAATRTQNRFANSKHKEYSCTCRIISHVAKSDVQPVRRAPSELMHLRHIYTTVYFTRG